MYESIVLIGSFPEDIELTLKILTSNTRLSYKDKGASPMSIQSTDLELASQLEIPYVSLSFPKDYKNHNVYTSLRLADEKQDIIENMIRFLIKLPRIPKSAAEFQKYHCNFTLQKREALQFWKKLKTDILIMPDAKDSAPYQYFTAMDFCVAKLTKKSCKPIIVIGRPFQEEQVIECMKMLYKII